MLFQQHEENPYCHMEMAELRRRFPQKWICKVRPVTWPPRSPDLTFLDLFFKQFIKDASYAPLLATTLSELAARIRDAMATVTLD